MASRHDLDRFAAEALELVEQLPARPWLQAIAAGMREHRGAAARDDPRDRILEGRPFVRDVGGLALGEVLVERRLRILHRARLGEKAREMRAAQDRLVRRERERPFERAG